MAARRPVGYIYGNVSSTAFDVAVSDESLKRLDYVEVEQDGQRVLGQVGEVMRRTSLSYDEAIAQPADADSADKLSAGVRIIGFQDAQGRIQTPRAPFRAGQAVMVADQSLVSAVLGLQNAADEGAYLGHVKGSRIPVTLSMDTLAQKHMSVLAKTGAGKSYTVAVILEEFLKANVPLVILDPHGEYGSLRDANMDPGELDTMARFKVKPKSFAKQVREYALDTNLNPEAARLALEGLNLEGRDIVDLLGGKLSGGQVGVLYQAIKEVKEYLPAYTIRDIMDGVARNKASSKWNVLNALEVLEATKVFDLRGTPVKELVAPGQCSIINLKGVAPDIQEIVVTRLTNLLWDSRKRGEIPAHILVVEEAHNFCPERNVGNAVSGPVIRTVASEGRKFGMGLVIVSQRPAKIDKNVLSQCNTQVVLKVTNPNDLKAIVQSVEGITNETADEVQRLPVGVALVAGGGLTQPVFVDVRPRMTKHGGRSVSVLHQELEEEDEPEADEPAPLPLFGIDPVHSAPTPPRPTTAEEWVAATPPTPAPPVRAPPRPAQPPALPAEAAQSPDEMSHGSDASEDPGPVALPTRRAWTLSQAQLIHRVAGRIGMVSETQDPHDTVEQIAGHELRHHRSPDARLALYLEIAETTCHPQPVCIRCPERAACQYQARLQAERKPANPIRRLWRN